MTKIVKRSKKDYSKENKKKQIKINSLQSLTKVRENVAGVDIGSEYHFVAAPDPKHGGKIVVNRFGTFTANLNECVEWLKQCNITSIAMEATGVYWKMLHKLLIAKGIEVLLVNPRDFKKMKDKKTDVCDCEFLQLYHSYGLFEGAIIMDKITNELQTFTRLREQSVMDSAACIQRMQKAFINMNVRLDNVVDDISGVTGMAIIRAILNGERDPKKLAKHRDPRCKKSEEEIEDSLYGYYQEDQLFALDRALRQYEFHCSEIRKCDDMIQAKLSQFDTHRNYTKKQTDNHTNTTKIFCKKKRLKSHEFSFNLKDEIERITGTNLTLLPAMGVSTALTLISETGLDMKKWQSYKHFNSWLGIAANNKVSGGKILQNRTKKKKKRAAIVLRMAVSGLYRETNDTAIGAFFRRKKAQIGAPKATTAAACKLGQMYYMALLTGKPFEEPGAKAYYERQKDKYLRRVRKQVKQWGYELKEVVPPVQTTVEAN